MMFQPRVYRNLISSKLPVCFRVTVKETDVCVYADKDLTDICRNFIIENRGYLEAYIRENPYFPRSLKPYAVKPPAPKIVRDMAEAGQKAGAGPMAAVAGAVAEHIGKSLLAYSKEIVIENGGDIFLKLDSPFTTAIFAGKSPLSMKIGLRFDSCGFGMGICTSSAVIGHSLSMGKADSVSIVSNSCSLADAAATSICNKVQTKKDIQKAIDFGKSIKGVDGIIIIIGKDIGIWGQGFEVVSL